MYYSTMTASEIDAMQTLKDRKEREREAILAVAFQDIGARAAAFGHVSAEVLLAQIETLCAECRETLATSKR